STKLALFALARRSDVPTPETVSPRRVRDRRCQTCQTAALRLLRPSPGGGGKDERRRRAGRASPEDEGVLPEPGGRVPAVPRRRAAVGREGDGWSASPKDEDKDDLMTSLVPSYFGLGGAPAKGWIFVTSSRVTRRRRYLRWRSRGALRGSPRPGGPVASGCSSGRAADGRASPEDERRSPSEARLL
ncbi:hypothetical protein THAOC_00317, partial [Thalassiosira oceanica]